MVVVGFGVVVVVVVVEVVVVVFGLFVYLIRGRGRGRRLNAEMTQDLNRGKTSRGVRCLGDLELCHAARVSPP